jgi:hypothetical protein
LKSKLANRCAESVSIIGSVQLSAEAGSELRLAQATLKG